MQNYIKVLNQNFHKEIHILKKEIKSLKHEKEGLKFLDHFVNIHIGGKKHFCCTQKLNRTTCKFNHTSKSVASIFDRFSSADRQIDDTHLVQNVSYENELIGKLNNISILNA